MRHASGARTDPRDNAEAASRRGENAFGRAGCIDGFVPRAIAAGDTACVTPQVREQILADNAAADARRGPIATPNPEPIGPQGVGRLGVAFDDWARANRVANASMIALLGDQVARTYDWGRWNADTIAPVASLSKAITAACVMALIDQRRDIFNEGTTIAQAMPAFASSLGPVATVAVNSIRVEHLLRHQSGLEFDPLQREADFTVFAAIPNADEAMAREALIRPVTGIARRYFYNNVNYAILGLMIRTITGEAYGSYCQRTVLLPRGARNARIGSGITSLGAFGGWEISAREFANFYLNPLTYAVLQQPDRSSSWRFMTTSPAGFTVVDGCEGCNYGLGVLQRPVNQPRLGPTTSYNMWHFGHWGRSSLTSPAEFGALFVRWTTNNYALVVNYDRAVSDAARGALITNLFNAANTADP